MHISYKNIFTGYVYAAVFMLIVMSIVPIVLDFIVPLNETRPKQLVFQASYPFDENKYFFWTLVHSTITCCYNMSVVFSMESIFAVTTQHACGLFAIVR